MSDVGNSLRIPMYLTASSPKDLMRLMLSNNLKSGKEHRYFDISFDGSKWVVWFYAVAEVDMKNIAKKGGK